ncbi:MAG: DegV family protein [Chloroflexi bacterium]|jgi:DegV family protein with EDD domain|nr:DegV family protein [Chloroflexota bacterium]
MTRIIGDTSSGITLEYAKEYGIDLIPQYVIFGEESYRDDTEITGDEFVKKLEAATHLPKTNAPPPALYFPIFDEMRKTNDDAIIICPSIHLSGTYRSALNAKAEYPDLDIRVIDTGIVGCGDAMLLLEAHRMTKAGISLDEIEKMVMGLLPKVKFYAVVDTLEYLYKGGRIDPTSKFFGDILQIKPVLTIKEGKAVIFEKQRTKKKAITRLVELIAEDCPKSGNYGLLSLSLLESINEKELETIKSQLKEKIGIQDIPFFNVPPAFMVHAGPGVIFATYFID